jgi:hypothetical protein
MSGAMKNRLFILLFIIFVIGCQPIQHDKNDNTFGMWKYSDVRLLDPIDASDPEQDLIALYTRSNERIFQIRIDFLDLDSPLNQDIFIPIDTNPGGTNQIRTRNNGSLHVEINWDYLIIIPESGNIVVVDSHYSQVYDMELLISLNSIQDNIVISFNQKTLAIITPLTKIQVLITLPNQVVIVDQTEPTIVDAPSPSRAKVLFAFWNTFASSTPAETLRSWAGAHSGPMSSRHGLKYLIDAAADTKTSIFILDLLKPKTLSGLDYIGVLPWVRSLVQQGRLILNDIEYSSDKINFINSNSLLFLINNGISNLVVNDYAQFIPTNNSCLISPSNSMPNINFSEILLKCKSQFVFNGLSGTLNPIILGGDFQNSLLGDPLIVNTLFTYIYNHPWIQVLTTYDFQTLRGKQSISPPPYLMENSIQRDSYSLHATSESSSILSQTEQYIYGALLDAPKNQISDLAWQVYGSFSHPSSSDLSPLGNNYIGQIGHILAAAKWADHPFSNVSCSHDLDYDGDYECILANNNIFVIIEPVGAYIPFIFTHDENGAHQIVGPTWEFILGLSDPSTWDPSNGIISDPGQILGAFVDDFNNWEKYKVDLFNKSIMIVNENMTIRKSFSITDNDITIDVQAPSSSMKTLLMPLVLDPWIGNTPGWGDKYIYSITPQGNKWGINSIVSVVLRSNNQLVIFPFNATHDAMVYPEDPNFDYGRGHYLPYPMALAEIHSTGDYFVNIVINP